MADSSSPLAMQAREGVTVVRFRDGFLLDVDLIQTIETDLSHLIVEQDEPRLLIDFSTVQVVSSRMLSALLSVHQQIPPGRGRLALCHVNDQLQRILSATRIMELLEVFPSVDAGVRGMQKGS